jgi:hypothetical protein
VLLRAAGRREHHREQGARGAGGAGGRKGGYGGASVGDDGGQVGVFPMADGGDADN